MRRQSRGALLHVSFLAALGLCFAVAAMAEEAQSYRVQWPDGWEVSQLPTPPLSSGKSLGGERIRAVRKENERVVAVLELSYYPRQDNGQARLEEEFDGVIVGVRAGYESLGLTVTVAGRKPGTLGSHTGLEAEISGAGNGIDLHQWVAMAFSPEYLYSFTFTGVGDAYEKHHGAFEATLRSLVLR